MQCRMIELRYKEVINISDGCRLGFVGDVEVMIPEGTVAALIVLGVMVYLLLRRAPQADGARLSGKVGVR